MVRRNEKTMYKCFRTQTFIQLLSCLLNIIYLYIYHIHDKSNMTFIVSLKFLITECLSIYVSHLSYPPAFSLHLHTNLEKSFISIPFCIIMVNIGTFNFKLKEHFGLSSKNSASILAATSLLS